MTEYAIDRLFAQSAVFDENRIHRYFLRRWTGLGMDTSRNLTFLMLNPSTADEHHDDPTIKKCLYFAKAWGYGYMNVVNLSPYRATDPAALKARGPDPEDVAHTNRIYVSMVAAASTTFVAAYGLHGNLEGRADRMMDMLERENVKVYCLGVSKEGLPLHPVRLAHKTTLQEYRRGGQPWANLTAGKPGPD